MRWNYRAILENECYTLREVFYDEDNSIIACAEEALELSADSLSELVTLVKELQEALQAPVLTVADLPKVPETQSSFQIQRGTSLEDLREELGLEVLETSSSET